MERIDFYEKKKALHNEMLDAIASLFDEAGQNVIDLSNKWERTWVTISPDGASSTREVEVVKVKCEDGYVSVLIDDECNNEWVGCEFAGIVMTDTLDNVYYSAFDRLNGNEMKVVKKKQCEGTLEVWFDNGAWVRVYDGTATGIGSWECQYDEDDDETYSEGVLEFSGRTLTGYDGCFELPKEVIMAVTEFGLHVEL